MKISTVQKFRAWNMECYMHMHAYLQLRSPPSLILNSHSS